MNPPNGKSHPLELMEPASPESLIPHQGLWPWFVAAALVLLIVLLLVLWGKRKPAAADPQALREAAFADAAAALANASAESVRDVAIVCSLVLRRYLSAAANDPSLFETHEEFVSRHDSLLTLTPDARAAAEAGFTRLAALKYSPEIPATPAAGVIAESRSLLETLHHGFAP